MPKPIVTLTLNPALDLVSSAEVVRPIHKIRTTGDRIDPGGGGINVARVIHSLGGDALAIIAVGGVTGRYIEDLLDEAGVPRLSVPIAGRTRICLTVLSHATGHPYRFVPQGPVLSKQEWQEVLDRIETVEASWIVVSGSLPPGAPLDAYAQVARLAARRGVLVALDTSGPALQAALDAGVELVKPSLSELETIAGHKLRTPGEQEAACASLVESGAARIVALTLGTQGALCVTRDSRFRLAAPAEKTGAAVGAGDSFLAALVLALSRGADPHDAISWGVAAGAAAASSEGTAQINPDEVASRYQKLIRSAET